MYISIELIDLINLVLIFKAKNYLFTELAKNITSINIFIASKEISMILISAVNNKYFREKSYRNTIFNTKNKIRMITN